MPRFVVVLVCAAAAAAAGTDAAADVESGPPPPPLHVSPLTDVTALNYAAFVERGAPAVALLYVACAAPGAADAEAEAAVRAAAAAPGGGAAVYGRVCVEALEAAARSQLPAATPYLVAVAPAGAMLEYDAARGWRAELVRELLGAVAAAVALPRGGGGGDGVPTAAADSDGVTALTPRTFHAATGGNESDAFVVFYNPSCAHCAGALPHFRAAARRFRAAGAGSVAFHTFDVAAHEPPAGVHFDGVPALMLFGAGRRAAREYGGEVEEGALLGFLRTHGTFPADVPVGPRAEEFRGRDVMGAVMDGLAIIREEVAGLRAENAALRARLRAAEEAGCAPAAARGGMEGHNGHAH